MFTPITFSRLEESLATALGWLELALVVGCFAAGWIVDRALAKRRGEAAPTPELLFGVVRLMMPLVALVLLIVASAVWKRRLPSLFLDVGVALALALAAIRMSVYTLRRLFPATARLKTSERTVSFTVWAAVALYVLGIAPEIVDELDALRLPIVSSEITLLSIAKGAIVVVVTLAATLWLSGLVEQRLAQTGLDRSRRALAAKFVRALLVVVGVLVAFQAIGFDLTVLSVFGGALGVGVGLGLQKLASNFIAGFVILIDRSVRLGDIITVDNRHGVVTEVTSRFVVVRSLDGIEAIVPNETLVTTTVLNHTLSEREARVAVNVLVAYGTDLDRALELLREVGQAHPRVRKDGTRAPAAFVVRFAETGIELELGVWIDDPESGQLLLKSDLNRRIWRAFQDAGIGVPVARRDVGVAGGPAATGVGPPKPASASPASRPPA